MNAITTLQADYPQAQCRAFGDTPALADQLAELVKQGKKTATCGSLAALQSDPDAPAIGDYSIILDGAGQPVCVIRTLSLRLVRFCDVTADFARKEGEGDLSLDYWRREHQRFFAATGTFDERMELVAEEFAVVDVLSPA